MKARASATFRMRQTLIRVGDIFEADEEYMRALARNRLVEIFDEDDTEAVPAQKQPNLDSFPFPMWKTEGVELDKE